MIRRIFLYRGGVQRAAIFEGEHGLVFGAVILIDAANVLPQRNAPHEEQEHRNPNQPIDQVEHDLLTENRIHTLQFRRRQQRQVLVHEDEKGDGEGYVHARHPAGDFKLLALAFFFATFVRAALVSVAVG